MLMAGRRRATSDDEGPNPAEAQHFATVLDTVCRATFRAVTNLRLYIPYRPTEVPGGFFTTEQVIPRMPVFPSGTRVFLQEEALSRRGAKNAAVGDDHGCKPRQLKKKTTK
jgi:hypothetical protein